jgi:cation transporter-like permease
MYLASFSTQKFVWASRDKSGIYKDTTLWLFASSINESLTGQMIDSFR